MPNFILIELPSPKEFEVELKGSVLAEDNEVESFFCSEYTRTWSARFFLAWCYLLLSSKFGFDFCKSGDRVSWNAFSWRISEGSAWSRFKKLLFAWNNLSRSYNLKQVISRHFICSQNSRNVKVSGAGQLREIVP